MGEASLTKQLFARREHREGFNNTRDGVLVIRPHNSVFLSTINMRTRSVGILVISTEFNNMEILTADEVAALLKISKSQVYELANQKTRTGEVRKHPIPVVRIGTSVRFRRTDVVGWLETLVENNPV